MIHDVSYRAPSGTHRYWTKTELFWSPIQVIAMTLGKSDLSRCTAVRSRPERNRH